MRRTLMVACVSLVAIGASGGLWFSSERAAGQATAADGQAQSVLGPGLYVFQTRTRSSTCGDAERDGYVLSYFAAINGVPGSLTMSMELVNTPHFSTWALKLSKEETLTGDSRIGSTPSAPEAHFEVTRDGDRWKGTGARTYEGKKDGKPTRCRVDFDALLRRIDTR